ncbi:putative malate dehydrogenase 1B [Trichogramma pretiosum]|uniref:putative malate dehydrogenase 1B n=1 Tax=Trichogramma pretiosum TaxID=7493 RepID=UPI0006C9C904|nr:putative malate dehydrogenase 1B [Trichogramma pretiosum]
MSDVKITTTIAGCSNCSNFDYACFIAENVSKLLPNFTIKIVSKSASEWEEWLTNQCKTYEWSHDESPLIWREIGIRDEKRTYIGGIMEFRIFINKYYGIDTNISKEDKSGLNCDYESAKNYAKERQKNARRNILHITISGAGRSVCPDLVAQLATEKNISRNGITIHLYDPSGHSFKLNDILKDARALSGVLWDIYVAESLSDCLMNCDILIILEHIIREDTETTQNWLQRNYDTFNDVAKNINIYAPSYMKVIFCSTGPACFAANLLAKKATKLSKNNIVAIAAHYGLEMMYQFMKSVDMNIEGISSPPVWGFLGINHFIDIDQVIKNCTVNLPNKRAFKNSNFLLPSKFKYQEFRRLFYLSHDKDPHKLLAKRKATCWYQVGRTEDYQKCKAICNLLKMWYSEDYSKIGDEIIFLGVPSNGNFNLPTNIYFSQPVRLKVLKDHSRIWTSCSDYPAPSDPVIIQNFVETAKIILKNMKLIDDEDM